LILKFDIRKPAILRTRRRSIVFKNYPKLEEECDNRGIDSSLLLKYSE
jgi:hypothetical protein